MVSLNYNQYRLISFMTSDVIKLESLYGVKPTEPELLQVTLSKFRLRNDFSDNSFEYFESPDVIVTNISMPIWNLFLAYQAFPNLDNSKKIELSISDLGYRSTLDNFLTCSYAGYSRIDLKPV